MDFDKVSKLVGVKTGLIGVPHSSNIQRLVDHEIRKMNDEAGEEWEKLRDPKQPVGGMPVTEAVKDRPGIETPTDDSGASQGSDAELSQIEERRM